MQIPVAASDLCTRYAEEKDLDLLVNWRIAFNIEATHAQPGPKLEEAARTEMKERIPRKELFILERNGAPVSFCGICGNLSESVIVGPVWTPVEERRRGYGRLVVAQGIKMLAEERPALREAVLFASRQDAIRAYSALGFVRTADWRLALMKEDFRLLP